MLNLKNCSLNKGNVPDLKRKNDFDKTRSYSMHFKDEVFILSNFKQV